METTNIPCFPLPSDWETSNILYFQPPTHLETNNILCFHRAVMVSHSLFGHFMMTAGPEYAVLPLTFSTFIQFTSRCGNSLKLGMIHLPETMRLCWMYPFICNYHKVTTLPLLQNILNMTYTSILLVITCTVHHC